MKRSAQIFLLIAALCAAVVVAVPLVMSSETVKSRIEMQLSDVTGRRVRLSGDSSLSFSPYLGVIYSNVTIGPSDDGSEPLVRIDEMRAQLGIFSVLWGEARLSKVNLVRPRLTLKREASGRPNWLPVSGRLRALLSRKDLSDADPFPLGQLTITEGIITLNNEPQPASLSSGARSTETTAVSELTAVNGTLIWPELAREAKIEFEAVWRGEVVKVDAQADTPFNLLTGQQSMVQVAVNANPVKFTYEGVADGDAVSMLEGAMTLQTPSLRRLAGWLNRTEDIAERLGEISLSGKLLKQNEQVSLTEATVLVDGDTGTGRLQLVDGPDRNLAISGTLAFDTLTLPAWSNFFRAGDTEGTIRRLDFSFLNTIDLDLRLSAQNARSNGLTIQNLAATLLVSKGSASMDIGSAEALDGVFSGVFSVEAGEPNQFLLEANFQQVDLPALTALLGQNNLSVRATGDARLRFKSQATAPREFLQKLSGEGTITARDGVLDGVDLSLAQAVGQGGSDATTIFSGTTPFDALQVGFFVSDGIVYLRNTSLENANLGATLSGKADLIRRSIALRGDVRSTEAVPAGVEDAPSHPFFIGGVAESPLYAPLPKRVGTKTAPKAATEPVTAPSQ
ncbi:MAG: AsmA family protein [Pseudomonadota bacterium]